MVRFFPFYRTKEYRVSVVQDDWVAPEETLQDSSSGHSDMEQPISGMVFRLTTLIIVVFLAALAFFYFRMSVVNHDHFEELAVRNKTVNFTVTPPRGIITDRRGKALVSNIPSFDLLVVSRELRKELGARRPELERIAGVLGIPAGEFTAAIAGNVSKNAVFFAASDLSKDQVLSIKRLDPKGIYIITGTKRKYADGPQFSSVIGYVGRVSKADLVRDTYYLPSDTVGRLGVEASYEDDLRGRHGKIVFSRGSGGGVSEEPLVGNTVSLNIDRDIQKKLYNELFEILRTSNLGAAAAIVQDPRDGAVLAMVSFPDFDNNIFNREVTQADFKRLFESKSTPLFNRVIMGKYNPGSTIKPFLGMAGLQEQVITPSSGIQDCVSITIPNPFNRDDPYVFKNWRTDLGFFNLRRAIANSCNIFFFAVGGGFQNITGLGVQKIVHYLTSALANAGLSIDLPGEEHGFVPDPQWKQETRGEPWYQGDTYNISIGQGDLLVTPLWLNSYVSAIANGGNIYMPRVAGRILDENGNEIRKIEPRVLAKLPFSPDNIAEVKNDMRETVLSGTARLLQDLPVPAGAKTGTSEVIKGRRINSLFTAFAPADNPEISITVLVEGSPSNEGYAIRTANEVLKWYFEQYKKQAVAPRQ